MAQIADHRLASAVSNAGGLGIIAAANLPAALVQEEIRKTRELTDKPFGVNVMMLSPYVDEVAEMVADEQVEVVTTGAGNPEKYFTLWKKAGIKIIPVVASITHAVRLERYGADAVICEGCEAGGHIGELTTMAMVPQAADAVNIPIIAAGGIGDGRGMAASFVLGAKGVQMGTRFLAADECPVHEEYKKCILNSKAAASQVTGRSTGHPVRVIRNQMTRKYLTIEKDETMSQEDKNEAFNELTLGSLKKAVIQGDISGGSVMAGQIVGLVNKRQSCKEIIEEVCREADELLSKGTKIYQI
jgi:enoyl-[acyl-carrier protein] reductase II